MYREKSFLNHQFPTVVALNDPPTSYEGVLRCEHGEVVKLAQKSIWPFTEYTQWNRFRLDLPNEHPLKPPVATWMTSISHPNIVPNLPGAVCVSILGDGWRPDLKLISVVNALHYLLSDPNPQSVFDHPNCLKAASVCRAHRFPKTLKRRGAKANDTVRFNVVPVPRPIQVPPLPQTDLVRFKIARVERRRASR